MNLAPGPRSFLGWNTFPGFAASGDRPELNVSNHERYGDVVRHRVGPLVVHMIRHPDHVKHVLQENHANYMKGRGLQKIKVLLGEGLLTSEGEFWRRQRKLAQPAFHHRRLAGLADTMVRVTEEMCRAWSERLAGASRGDATFDVLGETMKLTLEIATRTLFSTTVAEEAKTVQRALTVALEDASKRLFRLFDVPLWVPTRENIALRGAIAELDAVVFGIIRDRRQRLERGDAPPDDLLSMLMSVRDEETGESMNDRQLRDEVMTLFLAGHETTANALAWAIYLLDANPACRERLEEEVSRVLGSRSPTFADVPRLAYTKMCFEESLRLYPPAWIFGRKAMGADKLGSYDIPADSYVVICPYGMHRNPAYFENPRTFDPTNFSPEKVERRHKYAYLPFGGGPRICIGNSFALMEGVLILAMLAQRFRVRVCPGQDIVPLPTITLRPKHGVLVKLEGRESC